MLELLKKAIPSFGAFIADKNYFSFIAGDNTIQSQLKFSLSDVRSSNNRILQLEVKNISNEVVSINSLVVVEFYLPSFFPEKILENGWLNTSFSGYKKRLNPTKKKKFFLRRDQNPYSFKKEFGYLEGSVVNEWFAQIVGNSSSLVIGAITYAEQLTQVF